jgi:D-arabinose 1-dehydrogenase-like Zn-dependent alcohol dehydrogenase
MRAVILDAFDAAPAVCDDLPEPTAAGGGMVVRVRASSVNPVDSAIAAGMLRQMVGHDFPVVLGRDHAGTIEALGAEVEGYAVGDEVFGFHAHAGATIIAPALPDDADYLRDLGVTEQLDRDADVVAPVRDGTLTASTHEGLPKTCCK